MVRNRSLSCRMMRNRSLSCWMMNKILSCWMMRNRSRSVHPSEIEARSCVMKDAYTVSGTRSHSTRHRP
jgi:hypothetical protein